MDIIILLLLILAVVLRVDAHLDYRVSDYLGSKFQEVKAKFMAELGD